jgi:hypothetical protein
MGFSFHQSVNLLGDISRGNETIPNRVQDGIGSTIQQIRDLVTGLRAIFSGYCT